MSRHVRRSDVNYSRVSHMIDIDDFEVFHELYNLIPVYEMMWYALLNSIIWHSMYEARFRVLFGIPNSREK